MPATVTLATTTLNATASATDGQILVASTSGITPGLCLWVDRELMCVIRLGVGSWVLVQRGIDGTMSTAHASGSTLTIGRPDQFYATDPRGRPPEEIPVSPYINVANGTTWFAQGDTQPAGLANRWWQVQTTTRDVGALGVRTVALDPTSST